MIRTANLFRCSCGSSSSLTGPLHFQVMTDPSKTIISGHSRGGKVAFELMNTCAKGAQYTLIGVAGVDPDDGGGPGSGVFVLSCYGLLYTLLLLFTYHDSINRRFLMSCYKALTALARWQAFDARWPHIVRAS